MKPIITDIQPYTRNSLYSDNPSFREESKKAHIFDNKIIQSHLAQF